MVRGVCHQSATVLGDLGGNAERAAAAIAAAVDAGADVVVLPEPVTSGYLLGSREEAVAVAVSVEHPLLERWAAAAGGAVVVAVAAAVFTSFTVLRQLHELLRAGPGPPGRGPGGGPAGWGGPARRGVAPSPGGASERVDRGG